MHARKIPNEQDNLGHLQMHLDGDIVEKSIKNDPTVTLDMTQVNHDDHREFSEYLTANNETLFETDYFISLFYIMRISSK